MPLAPTLGAIAELHDLPRLLAELGHEPLWLELPVMPGTRRAATVGRRGRFAWLGVEGTTPPVQLAERLARRLACDGNVSGVIAFYPERREIAIAVAFGDPAALRIDLDAPDRIALACLERLRAPGEGTAIAYAARVADALAGRGIGRDFFRQFRATLDAMADGLVAGSRIDPRDRRSLALLQLTRVLFLYFVQSKGWLDGRPGFLAGAVDTCLAGRGGLQRRLLDPLFFGTLNRPVSSRSRGVAGFGRVPFLNGGLFEPHPLEQRYRPTVPDHLWRMAFDALFERFHFTVSESGGQGPAIAPDMLGRVFEGVMAPEDRRKSGTFYTPAALVRSLVDAAVVAAVGSQLGIPDSEAAERLRARDAMALSALDAVRLLDPACGSGAFLLGALERLASARESRGVPAAVARRGVLTRNLFGVDADAMAVRLAALRLWLAVVAHEEDPAEVRPLPNLDCLIRQGDSLFAPVSGPIPLAGTLARRLGTARARLVSAAGPGKRELTRELARLERTAAIAACRAAEGRLERAASEVLGWARAPSLFGDRPRMSAAGRARLGRIRARLRETRALRRRLARAGELPWFQYESHYADVMAAGGFDIVIGNPPWVRAEAMSADRRARLAEAYRWWRSAPGRGFAHQPDLSVAFLERAHDLARPGGVVALLVPVKLAAAGYGAAARAALVRDTTIHVAADLTRGPAPGFDATVYPMALVTTKRRAGRGHRARTSLEPDGEGSVRQRGLGSGPWILSSGPGAAAERLRDWRPIVSDRFDRSLGVKTGADRVFLDPPDVEGAVVRWAVRGRDVRAFEMKPRRRLLWTHDEHGLPLARLPPRARAHVEANAATLRARADFTGGPLWTVFRTRAAVARHRVIWADLARRLAAAATDDPGIIPLNTCYVAPARSPVEARALVAWLNSKWIGALARLCAPPAAGGFARFAATTIGLLPMAPDSAYPDLAAIADAGAAGEEVRSALDDLVARLLDLSRAERMSLATVGHAGTADRR